MIYSAFISYNHRDVKWAQWLHKQLESYRVPKRLLGRDSPFGPIAKRLPPVFRDRDELGASSDLGDAVRAALDQAQNLIVILSPSSAASRWVDEEVRYFITLGRRRNIFCLLVDGSPNTSDAETECLPSALRGNPGEEPLAADPRPTGDGRRHAVLKIVAGLLDLPFDELRQREAARRQRRLATIAIAASAGLVLTSGLAIAAWLARNEAVAQAEIARKRTLTAERTVDFVKSIFAVADPSEARGETITVREVLDSSADRLKTALKDEPAVKARLTLTLGEVYSSLGLYKRSDSMVDETFKIPHRDPSIASSQWIAIGEARLRETRYDEAIKAFRRVTISKATTPTQLSRALVGMGQALSGAGHDELSRTVLAAALKLDQGNEFAEPSTIARDLEAIGLTEYYAGRLPEAQPIIERALALRMKTEGKMGPSVSDNLNTLASIAMERGNAAEAERYFRRNLAIDEKVLGRDHPDLAITLNNLARLLIERGAFAEALPMLERALVISTREKGAMNEDLAFLYMNLGIARRGAGRPDAGEALKRGLAIAEAHKHRTVGLILGELADLDCAGSNAETGLGLADRAAKAISIDYEQADWRQAWIADVRGGCLAALERKAEAAKIFERTGPVIFGRWKSGSKYAVDARERRSAIK